MAEGATFDGASESETPIASLVDPLRDLPRVAVKAAVADPVTSVAYSGDGRRWPRPSDARSSSSTRTGKPLATLGDHPGPVASVRFTPDGKTLVAAGGRPAMFGAVTAWDVEKKAERFELRGHGDAILAAEVAPDGRSLATAGYDQRVILWDLVAAR